MTTLQYEQTALGSLYWRLGTGDVPLTDWVKADSLKQIQAKAKREGLTLEEYKARADIAPTFEEPKKRVKPVPKAEKKPAPKVETKPVQEQASEAETPAQKNTYDNREAWLNAFVDKARVTFKAKGYPLPAKIRVAIGFTSGGRRGKSIGECWGDVQSADGHFEIFLRPSLESDSRIADVLTHELAHAAVGLENKHNKTFKECVTALGLEGKVTATIAGDGWRAWADKILEELGPLPHGTLDENKITSGKKKQTTRLIKGECNECGLTLRMASKWVKEETEMRCPDESCSGVLVFG